MKKSILAFMLVVLVATAVFWLHQGQPHSSAPAMGQAGLSGAEPATLAANAETLKNMPATDPAVDADISHGFIGSIPNAETVSADGTVNYTQKGYEFEEATDAPPTVNPDLWRQARRAMKHGLFKIADGFYQVRGMDLTNMDIIEGNTGLIIIDPNLVAEVSRSALDLYYRYRPKKPIVAVIYNHSHVDHFGGVRGIVNEDDVKSGNRVT